MLKTAVESDVIDRVRMLHQIAGDDESTASLHDFDQYERLV